MDWGRSTWRLEAPRPQPEAAARARSLGPPAWPEPRVLAPSQPPRPGGTGVEECTLRNRQVGGVGVFPETGAGAMDRFSPLRCADGEESSHTQARFLSQERRARPRLSAGPEGRGRGEGEGREAGEQSGDGPGQRRALGPSTGEGGGWGRTHPLGDGSGF